MMRRLGACIWVVAGIWPTGLLAQEPVPVKRELVFDLPLHVELPVHPQIFLGDDGRHHLAYHALLLNLGPADLVFDRLDVIDPDRQVTLASYDTMALRRPGVLRVQLPDPSRPETARHLPPGRIAVLRAWISLESVRPAPKQLTHRFVFAPIPTLRIARAQNDTDAVPVVMLEPLLLIRGPSR
jgi:hypothetical protein